MPFHFSERSLSRLDGLHFVLRDVALKAIALSTVDFAITEGLRAQERQAELVKAGASRTMNGRHVTGHAVDVVAVVGGVLRWELVWYPQIAHAFRQAGIALHAPLVWGCVWDRTLNEIDYDLADAATQYQERWYRTHPRPANRDKREFWGPLIDGPHFELSRKEYPADPRTIPVTA